MKVSKKRRDLLESAFAVKRRLAQATGQTRGSIPARAEAAADPQTAFNRAVDLQQAGNLLEAVLLYEQALSESQNPHDCGVIRCNLGQALLGLYRRPEALDACEKAVALLPESVEALTSLGNVLLELGRIDEARGAYERALNYNPEWVPAAHNLNTVLIEEGRYEEALAGCEDLLACHPEFTDARLTRGILLLLRGDFERGWWDYEARFTVQRPKTSLLAGNMPLWRGEPLNNASILLYAEQGIGDAVQFLRYVPMVKSCGGRVALLLPPSLVPLAQVLGVPIAVPGEALPPSDWQCPLMSLPGALGLQSGAWAPAPWTPYLRVPEAATLRADTITWPQDKLRVGLVWAGSPDHTRDWARSIALDRFMPLLAIPHAQFYSLQTGAAARQLEPFGDQIIDLVPAEQDMAGTAARLLAMDLLIAVDTSVAHLAGALGKPVWLLVPAVPDWRWQLRREDSPWYPQMRIYRQRERNLWTSVIEELCRDLAPLAESMFMRKGRELEGVAMTESTIAAEETKTAGAFPEPSEEPHLESVNSATHALPPALVSAALQPCKICQAPSPLFGVVDFHKSCVEAQGKRLPLSGIPVYYRKCGQCGFLATDFFDPWPQSAFLQHVYNADYLIVDPDAEQIRPASNARLVAEVFQAARTSISVLDYGGGSGRFAELLSENGFNAVTYDPFSRHSQRPAARFDLITSFEVLEHAPSPNDTVAAMVSLLKSRERDGEDGLILFSTLLQPDEIEQTGVAWWYAAPRNGHCSLYTSSALARLFLSFGLQTASAGPALHMAYYRVPSFAAHLRIGNNQAPKPA